MKKKSIAILILFIITSIFTTYLIIKNKKDLSNQVTKSENTTQSIDQSISNEINKINLDKDLRKEPNILLFFGDGCPHCALVEKFVTENNIENKVSFIKKEVYYNKKNAIELTEKAKSCGMNTDSIGVPFLWDGTKCLVGDKDIINFFELKANE